MGESRRCWKNKKRPVWFEQTAKGREVVDGVGKDRGDQDDMEVLELSYHPNSSGEPLKGV